MLNNITERRQLIRAYLIYAVCLLALITKLYGSEITGRILTIDLYTTSDWTEVDFANVKYYYLKDTLIVNEGNNAVKLGILSIEKKAYDTTLVHAQYEVCLTQELSGPTKFVIKKGAVGITKTILHMQNETLAIFKANETTNSYTIGREKLHAIPIQSFSVPSNPHIVRPMVLAFYYLWYDKNWLPNNSGRIANTPLSESYNSSDEKMLQKQIILAKNAGIDGFIISWWGKNSFIDSSLKKIIPICESLGFKFTLYLETTHSLEDLRNDVNYIETTYARSSSFIQFENKPVLFVFSRILDNLPMGSLPIVVPHFTLINYGFSYSSLQGFSGFHEYLPPGNDLITIKHKYLLASQIARQENKLMVVTVMPGYDARHINNYRYLINRDNGKFYKAIWETALSIKPDWVLVTSFNEWFEGTEIEPSKEYGDLYLRLTTHYAQLFKEKK
jgi:hypothetical protein